jgi:hypothetical protein
MQYLAWIRDASRHVLVSNLFVLHPTAHDYLQPLVSISGLITALGVPPWITLLVWKPVAVGAVFCAIRAYVNRVLAGAARRTALVLALFFVGPGELITQALPHVGAVVHHTFAWTVAALDPWLGWSSWGYPFGLIAVAAALTAVLIYSREREEKHVLGLSPLLGAFASWLHPWQGASLITVLVACEIIESAHTGKRAHTRQLFLTTFAAALPIVYYVLLARVDPSWRLAQAAGHQIPSPLWALAICELPLALPAAFAYARGPLTFVDRATRVWPIAMLAVFLVSPKAAELHAFLGINVLLAILAVQGWSTVTRRFTRLRRPVVAWLAVGALTLPSLAIELRWAKRSVSDNVQVPGVVPQSIDGSEVQALNYLDRLPQPGGVLTRNYLGTVVPAETDRPTYVGNSFWSPEYDSRSHITNSLFYGRTPGRAARAFVQASSARFILVDCTSRHDLKLVLAPLLAAARRFGCADVYVLR